MKYCKNGCGRRVKKGNPTVCSKCSKKRIEDSGHAKEDGPLVYGLYNENKELIYVGVTNSVVRRTAEHMEQKIFVRVRIIRRFDSRAEANAFEIFAIQSLHPPLNILYEPLREGYEFDDGDLIGFGVVSTSNPLRKGRTCLKCETIISRYNTSELCRRHSPRPLRVTKKRKRETKARLGI